jgi:hypothetical protein
VESRAVFNDRTTTNENYEQDDQSLGRIDRIPKGASMARAALYETRFRSF